MKVWLCALVLAAGLTPALWAAAPDPELRKLLEQIARGDDADGTAADALIDRVTGPLEAALKDLDTRPLAEQVRVQAALARIRAVLRARVWRLGLPPEDRTLYDDFAHAQPRLVDQLFDDDADVRLAALNRVPLDPNTGAGVMIAARVDDWEPKVIEQALELSGQLADRVVVRNLVRQVQDWTRTLRSGVWQGDDLAVYRTDLGYWTAHAAGVIGRGHDPNAVTVLVGALEYYARPESRSEFLQLDGLVGALGRLGDERAVPVLLSLLADPTPVSQTANQVPPGKVGEQKLGDLALLSLAHIYRIDPAALGFQGAADIWERGTFPSEPSRTRALRIFKDWYAANASKPADLRQPLPTSRALTSQPAEPAPR